jgi:hypothetical protein
MSFINDQYGKGVKEHITSSRQSKNPHELILIEL